MKFWRVWHERRWLRWSVYALCMAVAVGLLGLLWKYPPGEDSFWPPCFFQRFTGLYCPGCGNTRAMYALLHLDFPTAFSRNLLLVPTLLLLPFLYASKKMRHSWVVGYTVAGCYIVFTILRNLPWYPFNLLAP